MSAKALQDMRGQHLSVAGFVGYKERTDSFLIRYVFPGSMTEDRPPPQRSRLAAIEAELASRGFIAEWSSGAAPLTLFYIRGPTAEVPDELVLRVGSPWEFLSGPPTEPEQTGCTGP